MIKLDERIFKAATFASTSKDVWSEKLTGVWVYYAEDATGENVMVAVAATNGTVGYHSGGETLGLPYIFIPAGLLRMIKDEYKATGTLGYVWIDGIPKDGVVYYSTSKDRSTSYGADLDPYNLTPPDLTRLWRGDIEDEIYVGFDVQKESRRLCRGRVEDDLYCIALRVNEGWGGIKDLSDPHLCTIHEATALVESGNFVVYNRKDWLKIVMDYRDSRILYRYKDGPSVHILKTVPVTKGCVMMIAACTTETLEV